MRSLKFALILFVIFVPVVVFSVANSEWVTVNLWPDVSRYGLPASPQIEMPLYLVGLISGLICLLIGLMFGLFYEWRRERGIRRTGREAKREAEALRAKLDEMVGDADDDLPALPSR